MKKLYTKKILFAYAILIISIVFVVPEISYSGESKKVLSFKAADHGNFYRIVFVLSAPDKAEIKKQDESGQLEVTFKEAEIADNLSLTLSNKYIKSSSIISPSPFVWQCVLVDSGINIAKMVLVNPDRVVFDFKKSAVPKEIIQNVKAEVKNISNPSKSKNNQEPKKDVNVQKLENKKSKEDIKVASSVSSAHISSPQNKINEIKQSKLIEKNGYKEYPQKVNTSPLIDLPKTSARTVNIQQPEDVQSLIPANAPPLVIDAVKDFKAKKYADAFRKFNQAIRENNGTKFAAVSHVLAAESLLNIMKLQDKESFTNALKFLNSALSLSNDKILQAKAYYLLGNAYSKMGFYDEASAYYNMIDKKFPSTYYATAGILERANLHFEKKEFDKALMLLNSIQTESLDAKMREQLFLQMASGYFKIANYNMACECFERATTLSSGFVSKSVSEDNWLQYAQSLYKVGRYSESKNILSKFIISNDAKSLSVAGAKIIMADVDLAEGREADAINSLSQLAREFAGTKYAGEAKLRRAEYNFRRNHNLGVAITDFNDIVFSDYPSDLRRKALSSEISAFCEQSKYNDALKILSKVKSTKDGNMTDTINECIGKIINEGVSFYYLSGNHSKIVELYIAANEISNVQSKGIEAAAALKLCESLIELSYVSEARRILEGSMIQSGIDEQNRAIYLESISYMKENSFAKAEESLRRFLQENSDTISQENGTMFLAESLYEQGKYEGSLQILKETKKDGVKRKYLEGKNFMMMSQYGVAVSSFKRALEYIEKLPDRQPLYEDIVFWMAYSCYKLDDYEEALSNLSLIDTSLYKSKESEVALLKVQILNQMGEQKRALKVVEEDENKNSTMPELNDEIKEDILWKLKHEKQLRKILKRGQS